MDAPPAPKKDQGFTLFKGHETKDSSKELIDLTRQLNSFSRRTREIESRSHNLRKKVQMIDQNIISQNKRFLKQIKILTSEIDEIKHIMNDLDNKMILLVKELRQSARKEDLNVLSKYVEFWEPINFITRNEVERIINDILDNRNRKV